MITTLKIERFKTIEFAELELGAVNVFIGANGSGKSNLLEALGVIAAAAYGKVDEESLARRGCRSGGYFPPLFAHLHDDTETALRVKFNGYHYAVRLLPRFQSRKDWTFLSEEFSHGEKVLVQRQPNDPGDPLTGLAALTLAQLPATDQASAFLKGLAGYNIYFFANPTIAAIPVTFSARPISMKALCACFSSRYSAGIPPPRRCWRWTMPTMV